MTEYQTAEQNGGGRPLVGSGESRYIIDNKLSSVYWAYNVARQLGI